MLADSQGVGLVYPVLMPVFAVIVQRLVVERLGSIFANDAARLRTVLASVIEYLISGEMTTQNFFLA